MKLKKLCTHKMERDVTKLFACSMSEDNKLAIVTNDGVEIMEFKHDPNESEILLANRWSHITLTTNLPTSAASNELSMELIYNLERDDLMNLILEAELFPVHPRAKSPEIDILQAKWSPKGLHSRSRCLFTTLTNRGECVIWAYISHEWISIASISQKCIELFKLECLINLDFKDQFTKLRENVKELYITSIEWSPLLDNFGFLATGHSSGKIFFWRINSYNSFRDKECSINKESFFLDLKVRINLLTWYQWENCFYLFVANIKGQAFLIPLKMNNSNLEQSGSIINLWDEEDEIKIGHCLFRNNDNETIIIFSKLQHILHVRLSKEGLVIKKEHFPVGLITGMEMLDNNTVLLTSYRGIIYKLDLLNNTGKNKPEQIENLRLENCSCLGLSAGNLRQFWFVILRICQPLFVKSSGEIRVFNKMENHYTLENNKPLWTQMEVLENIRLNCIQNGDIPGIEKIKEANWLEDRSPEELKKYLKLVLIAIAHEDTRDNEGRIKELLEFSQNIKLRLSILHALWLKKRFSSIWLNNSSSISNSNYITIWTLCNLITDEATRSGILKGNEETFSGPDLCTESCCICEEPITISLANDGLYKAIGSCKHNVNRCSFTFRQIGLESILICENCPGVYSCLDGDLLASPDSLKCLYCDSLLEYDEHQHN